MGCVGSRTPAPERKRSKEKSVKSRGKSKRSSKSRGARSANQVISNSKPEQYQVQPKQENQIIEKSASQHSNKQKNNEFDKEIIQVKPNRQNPLKNDDQNSQKEKRSKKSEENEHNTQKPPSEKYIENKQLPQSFKNINPETNIPPSRVSTSKNYVERSYDPELGSDRAKSKISKKSDVFKSQVVDNYPSKRFSKISDNNEEIVMVQSYMDFGQTTIKNPRDMKIVMNL